jgi:hypothetical protein
VKPTGFNSTPSTSMPSLLFQVMTSLSPSAKLAACGLVCVNRRKFVNVASVTYTSLGIAGESIVTATTLPSLLRDP